MNKVYSTVVKKEVFLKHLLYTTGNSAQCYLAGWKGEGFGEERMHAECFAAHLKL